VLIVQWILLILLTTALIGLAKHWYSNHEAAQRTQLAVRPKRARTQKRVAIHKHQQVNPPSFFPSKTGMVIVHENLLPLDGKCPVCEKEWFNLTFGQPFQHQCGCVYHTQCIQYCVRNGQVVCFFCGKTLNGRTWRSINVD